MAKTILTEEQKAKVINFIKTKPEMNSKEIASILNYPVECVRSSKSHVTMRTYDKEIIDDDSEIDYEISLSMEKDLQKFLLSDLSQIEPGLKLVEKAKDDALEQILGYMGFISETLANGKPVLGYIIANDFEERLKYAVKNVSNVMLKAYKVNFSFVDINRE